MIMPIVQPKGVRARDTTWLADLCLCGTDCENDAYCNAEYDTPNTDEDL